MIDTVQREIVEIQCKSLLNRVVSEKMPFRWSINPYRGCEHKCVYCYARRYHAYFDLGPGLDFERKIFVKVNAPKILRQELSKKSWQRESVAIGTAVDPYQPVEGKYKLTRRDPTGAPRLLDSVLGRDQKHHGAKRRRTPGGPESGPGCRVWLSITTLDEALARRLEPDTPSPRETVGNPPGAGQKGRPCRGDDRAGASGTHRRSGAGKPGGGGDSPRRHERLLGRAAP